MYPNREPRRSLWDMLTGFFRRGRGRTTGPVPVAVIVPIPAPEEPLPFQRQRLMAQPEQPALPQELQLLGNAMLGVLPPLPARPPPPPARVPSRKTYSRPT